MNRRTTSFIALVAIAAFTTPIGATIPLEMPLQGVLRDNAGQPVVEGAFEMTFTLYGSGIGGEAVWTETWASVGDDCQAEPSGCVSVVGGNFRVNLGSVTPLDPSVFAAGTALWLGVTVEGEPELPWRPLGTTPFSFHAETASTLACSGCVEPHHLSDAATAHVIDETLAAVELAGFAKVGDLAVAEADLPANGLNEVSNGLLTNQFVDTVMSQNVPLPIADNNPVDYLSDTLVFPQLGTVEAIRFSLQLSNSNTSQLTVTLTAPNGAAYTVHASGGAADTLLGTTYPDPTVFAEGDITEWVGENPAGTWTLSVVDGGYLNNATDGELLSWGFEVHTLSSQKVAVSGDLEIQGAIKGAGLEVDGNLDLKNHHLLNARFQLATTPPVPCDADRQGFFYFDTNENALRVCVGTEFRRISTAVCGDGIREGAEQCDDGGLSNGDGCNAVCAVEDGFECAGNPTSVCAPICGDGFFIVALEGCDDGNLSAGDGCNSDCVVEVGYACVGALTSICSATCGDSFIAEGEETCDDGNFNAGDGCDSSCQVEVGWSCPGEPPSVCVPICGDGLEVGTEQCDDNNVATCDGCSPTCQDMPVGLVYDGVCLVSTQVPASGSDNVPAGCDAYQPSKAWGESDYQAVCNHFKSGTDCVNVDTDSNMGLCTNHAAVVSFENNDNPDVYVHANTFGWDPATGTDDCSLCSDTGCTVVYACE